MNPLDDPFYYLNNFQTVLDWVRSRYEDLLQPDEIRFIDDFASLPRASQALLVRMVMRKGTLFRHSRLIYDEIGSTTAAAIPLTELGWIDTTPDLSLEELFALLTRTEIVKAFAGKLNRPQGRKTELFEQLIDSHTGGRPLQEWWPDTDDRVLALNCMALCDRFRLMFFGNLRQDWSEFVLADLGVYRYETVEFSTASRAFRSRRDLDTYLHLHQCRERFEAGEAIAEIHPGIPGPIEDNPWLENRRGKLLFTLGQHAERTGEPDMALMLYRDTAYPGARARRIRVLERSGDLNAALALADAAARSPENDAECQLVERIRPRLQRKLGVPVCARPPDLPVERIDLNLPEPASALPVEAVALAHLREAEGPVYYVENTLINGLFGLLCWEAIFAAVPGAFFHPFHTGPADLLQPDFRARRDALFSRCLSLLDGDDYRTRILENFDAKNGIQSPFVFWDALSRELLEQALACFPAEHLRAWFGRLLADIRANRAGLPDLVQFWPGERRYRMIEVKGPGDRLQDNQRRWLNFCAAHQMPVAVCYVQWRSPHP